MPNPKRQHSKQRTRKRRTHQKIAENFGSLSTEGSRMGYNHRVDPVTGYYKGKQIIDVSKRAKKAPEQEQQ
jgi:large subunit ribosomal protein L32